MSIDTTSKCAMSSLRGKTVTGISISSDQTVLIITHNQGQSIYRTEQEDSMGCTNICWIADIIGVANLLGQKVVSAEDIEVPEVEDERGKAHLNALHVSEGHEPQKYTRDDLSENFYGIKLATTRGYVEFIYRNCANSWPYGGELKEWNHEEERKQWAAIRSRDPTRGPKLLEEYDMIPVTDDFSA